MPKVGDTIWVFDRNHREYSKDNGSAPIWRAHWRPRKVTGETSRSWVLEYGGKCPKKRRTIDMSAFAFSQEEIAEQEWVRQHPAYIRRQLMYEPLTIPQWKQIAEIIGYKEAPDAK